MDPHRGRWALLVGSGEGPEAARSGRAAKDRGSFRGRAAADPQARRGSHGASGGLPLPSGGALGGVAGMARPGRRGRATGLPLGRRRGGPRAGVAWAHRGVPGRARPRLQGPGAASRGRKRLSFPERLGGAGEGCPGGARWISPIQRGFPSPRSFTEPGRSGGSSMSRYGAPPPWPRSWPPWSSGSSICSARGRCWSSRSPKPICTRRASVGSPGPWCGWRGPA